VDWTVDYFLNKIKINKNIKQQLLPPKNYKKKQRMKQNEKNAKMTYLQSGLRVNNCTILGRLSVYAHCRVITMTVVMIYKWPEIHTKCTNRCVSRTLCHRNLWQSRNCSTKQQNVYLRRVSAAAAAGSVVRLLYAG